jgi:hypothetical protein
MENGTAFYHSLSPRRPVAPSPVSEFQGFGIRIVLLIIRQPEMKKSKTGQ